MKPAFRLVVAALVLAPAVATAAAPAPETPLPVVGGRKVVAKVNDDPVFYDSVKAALAEVHVGAKESGPKRAKQNPSVILDRLITVRLCVQEAERMGLDQTPEFQNNMDAFGRQTLEEVLLRKRVESVLAPDPKDVEALYRAAAGKAKFATIGLPTEESAQELEAELKKGGDFDTTVARWVKDGRAKMTPPQDDWVPLSSVPQEVARALASLKPGEFTAPLPSGTSYGIGRLADIRIEESPDARVKAKQDALELRRLGVLGDYGEELKKKYARVDKAVLGSLDFEAEKPTIEELAKDPRVVATVNDGGPPITVADIVGQFDKRFFHGAERAAQKHKLNKEKSGALHTLVLRRVNVLEAKNLGLDRTPAYLDKVKDHHDEVLFGSFVAKAVKPDVHVEEGDVRKYYEAHTTEFSSPPLVRVQVLGFAKRDDANAAIAKLRAGADFEWLRQNSRGQVKPSEMAIPLTFGPKSPIDPEDAGEEIARALAGAATGDARLLPMSDGSCAVLGVVESIPAAVPPFDSVRGEVTNRLYGERLQKALEEWSAKLKAASKVQVYATGDRLNRMLRADASSKH